MVSFYLSEIFKVLFQRWWFPNKPQSPTLVFIPALCPLPRKSLLPESARGAKSVHLCVWETRQRNHKIQPSERDVWVRPLRWDPRAVLEVQEGLSCFYCSCPPARTPLGSSTGGAVGWRSSCRQSPSSLVSPLPRLAGATAHPVPLQGVSRGKQRTPHICDCTRGRKIEISFSKSFILETKIIHLFRNQCWVQSTWFILHAISPPSYPCSW